MSDSALRVAAWLGLAASLAAGCSNGLAASGGHGGASGGGGGGQTGGAAAGASGMAGSGGGGGGGGAGAMAASCNAAPTPLRAAGTIVELPIDLVYEGRPFVYGEPNRLSSDVTVTPVNVRFYVSSIELLTATGGSVPVDVVTSDGAVQTYDLFLFNAEDAAAQTVRVLAPPGAYTGVKLALGIGPACNMGTAAGRVFPLSDASQMTWPHLAGYLFLRYESDFATPGSPPPDGGPVSGIPSMVHMGADIRDLSTPAALVFRVPGSITVPATGSVTRHLRLAIDQVLKGATADVDLSDYPFTVFGAEVAAGERLRRTGESLPLFELAP